MLLCIFQACIKNYQHMRFEKCAYILGHFVVYHKFASNFVLCPPSKVALNEMFDQLFISCLPAHICSHVLLPHFTALGIWGYKHKPLLKHAPCIFVPIISSISPGTLLCQVIVYRVSEVIVQAVMAALHYKDMLLL